MERLSVVQTLTTSSQMYVVSISDLSSCKYTKGQMKEAQCQLIEILCQLEWWNLNLSGKIVFIHLQIGTGCQQDDRNSRQTSKSKQL